MEVIQLPAPEAPASLSARMSVTSYSDRKAAFLNVNNKKSFVVEAPEPKYFRYENIRVIIASEGDSPAVELDKLKKLAKMMRKVSGKEMRLGQCLEILAQSFGYKNYLEALRASETNRGFIRRLAPLPSLNKQMFGL